MKLKELLNEGNKLNEAENKTDRLVRFFSIKGIDTKYDAAVVKEWGKDTVDMAIKSAPKILALKKKIDSIGKDIAGSDEGKLLIKIMKQSAGFVYDYRTGTEVGALFGRYYKGK